MKSLRTIYKYLVIIDYILLLSWICHILFYAIFHSSDFYKQNINDEAFTEIFTFLILTNVVFYFYIQKSVQKLIQTGIFSKENAKQLKYAGFGLFGYWIINVIIGIYSKGFSLSVFSENKSIIIPFTIIGFIFIIMSAILEDGIQLKEDNDLTI